MKFFTRGWAQGEMSDAAADAVVTAYHRHLDEIALPPAVRALADLNPHDAYVLVVEHVPTAGTLRLRLRCGDLQSGYFDADVRFSGVTLAPTDAAALVAATRPAEVQILYDEVDHTAAGTFEYRLLLHPDGQIAIRFDDVRTARRPVADRREP